MTYPTRSQGRRKSKFPADTGVPAGATFDFVAGGANYKITLADLVKALNVTGVIQQEGDPLGVPILDSQDDVHKIRNLDEVVDSGLKIEVTARNGIAISLDAQVASGTGIPVLDSANKIRHIKAGAGISVTLVGDDIVIAVT